jgi:branched-chain amino acid transport system substrate-binding protein
VNLRDTINATGVACLGWTGTTRFYGEYCFTVANGDIPTEGVMAADWCFARGHAKVGFFWEQGSSGDLYADFFRSAAGQYDLEIIKEVRLGPNPRDLERHLATMRAQGADAIVYMGYGYATFHFARSFQSLGWDPPRFMGTAFMFYSNSNAWAEGLEGWHGVDQLGEDGTNPNYEAMLERFEARFGRVSRNVVVALSYDTARRPARHRERPDRHSRRGQGRPGADQVDAVHQRRARIRRRPAGGAPPRAAQDVSSAVVRAGAGRRAPIAPSTGSATPDT